MTLKTTDHNFSLMSFFRFFFHDNIWNIQQNIFYGLNDMHSGALYQFFSHPIFKKISWVVIWKENINDFCRNKKSQITTRIFFYFHFLLKIFIKKICLSLFLFWASLIMQTNKKIIEKIKLVKISHCVLATIKCTGD